MYVFVVECLCMFKLRGNIHPSDTSIFILYLVFMDTLIELEYLWSF